MLHAITLVRPLDLKEGPKDDLCIFHEIIHDWGVLFNIEWSGDESLGCNY